MTLFSISIDMKWKVSILLEAVIAESRFLVCPMRSKLINFTKIAPSLECSSQILLNKRSSYKKPAFDKFATTLYIFCHVSRVLAKSIFVVVIPSWIHSATINQKLQL